MTVGTGITNGFPEPTKVPPQLVLNHLTNEPVPLVTERDIFPPIFEQKLFISDVPDTGGAGRGITDTSNEMQEEEAQLFICHLA